MDLSSYLPFMMLLVFAAISLRAWKTKSNNQTLLMICMGWAGIAVLSLTGSILFFVTGRELIPIFLLILSPISAFVATKFKTIQRT